MLINGRKEMTIFVEMANLTLLGSQSIVVELNFFVMKNCIASFPNAGSESIQFLEDQADAFGAVGEVGDLAVVHVKTSNADPFLGKKTFEGETPPDSGLLSPRILYRVMHVRWITSKIDWTEIEV
jgi:hypothetical protein